MGTVEDVALFEKRLAELITKYEQYFLGLEKREPLKLLEEVDRLSRKYTGNGISNTMLLFRYNSLKSRFVSYRQYWNRTTRLMDEGKYSRDRFRMEMPGKSAREDRGQGVNAPDPEMEELYRQFIDARKACHLPVESVTREMVADVVARHKLAAMEKYRCAELEMRITIEDGRPKLKIRPKP